MAYSQSSSTFHILKKGVNKSKNSGVGDSYPCFALFSTFPMMIVSITFLFQIKSNISSF